MTRPLLAQPIERLADLLNATRGIARALDPDPVFSEQDRVNLYFLTMLLAEQLETCLREFMQAHIALQTATAPAQDEEDDDAD